MGIKTIIGKFSKDTKETVKKTLDLNNDGKVDAKDMEILRMSLFAMMATATIAFVRKGLLDGIWDSSSFIIIISSTIPLFIMTYYSKKWFNTNELEVTELKAEIKTLERQIEECKLKNYELSNYRALETQKLESTIQSKQDMIDMMTPWVSDEFKHKMFGISGLPEPIEKIE